MSLPTILAAALLLVAPVPNPKLTPGEVVEIQVEALQRNDKPRADAGIATTFQFASPGNRQVTGPLEHFAQIVKAPEYRPILGHRVAGYGPTIVVGNLAFRRVTIIADDGKAHEYEFRLSKDPESSCWFTDGVVPVPAQGPIDAGKVAWSSYFIPSPQSEPFLHPDLAWVFDSRRSIEG